MQLNIAAIAGHTAGLMTDLFGWLLIVTTFLMGWLRPPVSIKAPIVAAVIITAVHGAIAYAWAARVGALDAMPRRMVYNAIGFLLIALAGYGLARLARRIKKEDASESL